MASARVAGEVIEMDLFQPSEEDRAKRRAGALPLAAKLRPKSLEGFVGQKHLMGENGPIRLMIESGIPHAFILWGPPGTGKTTIARLLSEMLQLPFVEFSAVTSGIKEVKDTIALARERLELKDLRTVLFIDEFHRFNKLQQDAFLPHVENGTIILIGATTENPFFSLNRALLSRLKIFKLEQLEADDLKLIANRAVEYIRKHSPGMSDFKLSDDRIDTLIRLSSGDARIVINAVEVVAELVRSRGKVDDETIKNAFDSAYLSYDKTGDAHYDTISAYIKSLRGSDPDAAIYYLAKMLSSGEDPKFIARRLMIQAAEDVGNANPMALLVANAAREAVEFVGMPEAQIPLAQATIYVAVSPKSNASYMAINAAMKDIKDGLDYPVPLKLRNAPFQEEKEMFGFSQGYHYAHSERGGWVAEDYLPEEMAGTVYYEPKGYGKEKEIKQLLDDRRKKVEEIRNRGNSGEPE